MVLFVYGMHICPDCEEALRILDEKKVTYRFFELSEKTAYLKHFLKLRDTHPVFEAVRGHEKIGIPCFVRDDGFVTLDIHEILK